MLLVTHIFLVLDNAFSQSQSAEYFMRFIIAQALINRFFFEKNDGKGIYEDYNYYVNDA